MTRVRLRHVVVEQREQPLGRGQVAGGDQRLDRDRGRQVSEVLVQLIDIPEARRDLPPARFGITTGQLEHRARTEEIVDLGAEPGPLGDSQQLRDLPARLLDLTPVGVDLRQHVQAERLHELSADLTRNLHRLLAQSGRPRPTCPTATSIRARRYRRSTTSGSARSVASAMSASPYRARLVVPA